MPKIYYVPDDREVETSPATTILRASLEAGIPHAHACGGNARCSTCRVLVLEGVEHCGPRNEQEQQFAERLHFNQRLRLACQTTVTGNVRLRRLALDANDVELISRLSAGATPSPIGEEKYLAILFADIRGFTALSELLPPYDVIYILNRYFSQMDQVISRHGGYIDNYIGDGIMALFGISDATDAALNAVRAGVGMLEAVERLQPYLTAVYKRGFEIGIGVHYGEVVVGGIGAPHVKKVTAIGDAVNFASRIESANKAAGTKFLISEETYAQVSEQIRVGRIFDNIALPGKSRTPILYEVIGLNEAGEEQSSKDALENSQPRDSL